MKTETTKRIETRREYRLTGDDIKELLHAHGQTVAADAVVTFVVPSGADWSGMAVPIDADNPVFVLSMSVAESKA